eukprot:4493697-Pleurochrysis_carterae.AAC.2
MEAISKFPGVAEKLCIHLLGPRGAVTVVDLKEEAGLHATFANTLKRYIFPEGAAFPESESFGTGKDKANKQDTNDNGTARYGWHQLKIKSPEQSNKTATEQAGGMANMVNHLHFSVRLEMILMTYLFAEGRPNITMANKCVPRLLDNGHTFPLFLVNQEERPPPDSEALAFSDDGITGNADGGTTGDDGTSKGGEKENKKRSSPRPRLLRQ